MCARYGVECGPHPKSYVEAQPPTPQTGSVFREGALKEVTKLNEAVRGS